MKIVLFGLRKLMNSASIDALKPNLIIDIQIAVLIFINGLMTVQKILLNKGLHLDNLLAAYQIN